MTTQHAPAIHTEHLVKKFGAFTALDSLNLAVATVTFGATGCLTTLPNAELVMASQTGHWMQWERADLFNQLVRDFLLLIQTWARG
ncbi:hypothetical protein MABM_07570 [Mycobacteroides abscessus]|nr:hypothetical protein MABM_07570 [Mycobacteroides abscessus]